MMHDNASWVNSTVASVNDDESFQRAAEHFDGSIALEIGETTVWLKLYRGAIIDTESYVPRFGATFRLTGEAADWQRLANRELSFSQASYQGIISSSGDKLEANRMREAIELFVRHLQRVVANESAETRWAE